MSNNVGIISAPTKLSRTIGNTIDILSTSSALNTLSGEIDIGFMAFDTDGTMGVCTTFTRDEYGVITYTFKTMSLNTEIDITTLLSQTY